MPRGYLVTGKGSASEVRTPVEGPVVIGRTAECGIIIDDAAASRQHVEVAPRGNTFHWRDLGSTNGTVVNGRRMLEGELKDGDRIEIGETALIFEVEAVEADSAEPEVEPAHVEPKGQATMRADYTMDVEMPCADRSASLLRAAYSVMNAVTTIFEPCPLVDRILETTVKAIHAQRGAIFFRGSDDSLLPCPVCQQVHFIQDGRLQRAEQSEIRVSSTVANKVFQDGESVLFQNTGDDADLNAAQSIMTLQLRSIICVPLRAKHGILGILYIDTDRLSHQYTEEDLLLSTSVGNTAGIALENANMHQQILDKQRMEQEIEYAWTIQESFLVKDWANEDPRFEVYGQTRPAKVVGGDFYDFVRPAEGRVGVLIGDVSGKGIPAALAMAQLLAAFRLYARDEASPAKVLEALNEDLVARSQRGMFCSICYITLDLATGKAVLANAGHLPGVWVTREGAKCFGDASGPPTGILPGAQWTDVEWEMGPGDALLMYTDGIIEARSCATTVQGPGGATSPEEYGIEALCRVCQKLYGIAPQRLLEEVAQDVYEFSAPDGPHDDCTMIALRYVGDEARHPD